jgi:ABC-type antimicrobial peptide transport system permease subunit
LLLAAAGLAIGVGAVVAISPALASLLFGVTALDPLTMFATAAVLCAVALASAWWPAWVASRVDPVVALRCE